MTWQPISSAPDDGTHILIRYFKGGKNWRTSVSKKYIVIEGYFYKHYVHHYVNGNYVPTDEIRETCWLDALDRLIVTCECKNPKNFVTHWMPMPEEPKDE